MIKSHKNKILKELVEVAKISLFLTGAILAALIVMMVIGAILSTPPFKGMLFIFFSIWVVIFFITYSVYKWQNWRLKIK